MIARLLRSLIRAYSTADDALALLPEATGRKNLKKNGKRLAITVGSRRSYNIYN